MRVAITGSSGRLGGAVASLVRGHPGWEAIAWTRRDFDLDAPDDVDRLLDQGRPGFVIHCAAWTDVDGCARDPDLAARRNGLATGVLAERCAARGVSLLAVSTNEVFDGRRTDHQPYRTSDLTEPPNAYGRSKLLGEERARAAFDAAGRPDLWIVRTAWLFGPPGADFPAKILAAARAAGESGRALSLVADEVGNPTSVGDLATAILDLIAHPESVGLHHVVNDGLASRAAWARLVLATAGVSVPTEDVSIDAWPRASTPPRWGVLAPTLLPTVGRLRPWSDAVIADVRGRFSEETEMGGLV
jgi:dTDP-4-dehydrorhamnose reductase